MPSIPYLMSQRSLQQNAAHLRDADRARGESGGSRGPRFALGNEEEMETPNQACLPLAY